MNVSVVDLSANQKQIQVEIPAEKVQKELQGKYRDLARKARIKGFRPGKVPLSVIKSYYGKSIEHEVSSQFIQESFPEALRETRLKLLAEADVSELRFEENGAFVYVAVVDVCPPFEVDGYKGMQLKKQPVVVTDEQVTTELERLREQNAQLQSLGEDHLIAEGDVVVVDFTPYVGDKVFQKGMLKDYMVEMGKNTIHPDMDRHIVGHKAGETVSFEVDFADDAPTAELRGRRVRFEAVIKEVKQKQLPELDDELAQTIGKFDTLEALKDEIRQQLTMRGEESAQYLLRHQINEELLKKVTLDLSEKAIEQEVDRLIENFQNQFKSQGLNIDLSRFNSPEVRSGYREQAVVNLTQRLVLQQIARQEGIELSEDEVEEIYRQIALYARMDLDRVKNELADSTLVEQSKEGKIHEKVYKLIEEAAVYTEASPTEATRAED